ncbi:bifunctional anthranilate synthase component I family protein/class IV aminotransferase [Helicobacter sp.]|uniref:bifunctional chorismate-binding protein/class IV aminotransferase n=1 Tax=Helicobacter sp. TaxID=218 RepID=UPI002A74D0D6|nr:bifunctional anthranilate synthase component I family protein/class IV aminotransferase [Helicobacter sp.]MDY2584984.1 bifunctional anthranilate synthase component I family protein/class IV aminotransferase [Helicobacter sp.]
MFCIYGKYCYEKPLRSIVCFKSADIMESFREIQSDMRGFWVGYVCYEALNKAESKTPLLEFVLFSERKKWKQGAKKQKSDSIFSIQKPFFYPSFTKNFDKNSYMQGFLRIKEELSAGNTYQVNFTQELQLKSHCEGFEIFKALSQRQKTAYCCYFKSGFAEIISLSPELFFKIRGEKIIFAPMKGTIKRGENRKQDKHFKKILKNDSKSQSENLMIVDLLRNDMSQIIKLGSLKIPKLLKTLKFKTLFQMVSILKARLKTRDLGEIFKAVFPCGSITGAPKHSTMRVIKELEQRERGVYCGALGVIEGGKATFSVPIRTLAFDGGVYRYGVGSGIVWDSNAEEEFKELQLKARFLTPKLDFMLFETMLMCKDRIFLLHKHKKRLINSAKLLGFSTHKLGFLKAINAIETPQNLSFDDFLTLESKKLESLFISTKEIPYFRDLRSDEQCYKVHLTLQENGDFTLTQSPLDMINTHRVGIANASLNSQNDLLYHKTTLRAERAVLKGYFDRLYCNEKGELCEGDRSNVVLVKNGECLTPPLECGMLGGTLREVLLECGVLKERVLCKGDLEDAKVFCVNSLRGVVPVELV